MNTAHIPEAKEWLRREIYYLKCGIRDNPGVPMIAEWKEQLRVHKVSLDALKFVEKAMKDKEGA